MSSFEFNKIFAAVLVAGITAMLAGFVANKIIHPHELEEDVVFVEGAEIVGGTIKEAVAEPILHLIATADVAKGQKLSKACAACHSFDKGGPNKVGPGLWNVVGADKGTHAGFSYSDAMGEMAGDWNYLSLNKFLWKPKKYMPGTKMNYIGLRKPDDRAAMVAWLRTLADSPAPLPSDADIEAEKAELAPPEEESAEEEGTENDSDQSASDENAQDNNVDADSGSAEIDVKKPESDDEAEKDGSDSKEDTKNANDVEPEAGSGADNIKDENLDEPAADNEDNNENEENSLEKI